MPWNKKDCEVLITFDIEELWWGWRNEHDRRREMNYEMLKKWLKTSGFFNAGLTPCSHTTTTKDIQMSPSLGFICIWWRIIIFIILVVVFCSVSSGFFLYLNTLPGVSTQ